MAVAGRIGTLVAALGLGLVLAGGAEAASVRRISAAGGGATASALAAAPGLPFRVTADDDDGGDRWLLDPIDGDYDRPDARGFRLRVRGAKVKMRMPIDLR